MRYSRLIGLASCLLLILAAFLPWVTSELNNETLSGVRTGSMGEPGYVNIVLATLIMIDLAINRVWSIRLNIVFAALVIAYNIRNYLIFTRCELGYCPRKDIGLFLTVIAVIVILISSLLPSNPRDFKPD